MVTPKLWVQELRLGEVACPEAQSWIGAELGLETPRDQVLTIQEVETESELESESNRETSRSKVAFNHSRNQCTSLHPPPPLLRWGEGAWLPLRETQGAGQAAAASSSHRLPSSPGDTRACPRGLPPL